MNDYGDKSGPGSHRALLMDPKMLTISSISFAGTLGSRVVSTTLPSISAEFAVSDAQLGLMMTAYTLPGIVLIPVLTVLADLYGRRAILLPALTVFAASGFAISFVDQFEAILALRFVQGMVAGAIIPLAITILGDIYSGPVGTTAQGLRMSANGVSQISIPAIAGFLAGISWQFPFLLFVLVIPVIGLGFLFLPRTVSPQAVDTDVSTAITSYFQTLRGVFGKGMLVIVSGGMFQGFAWYGIVTFLPLFAVRELGASTFEAGVVLSLIGLVRIIVAPMTGTLLGFISRRQALIVTLLVSAAGASLIGFTPTLLSLGAVAVLFSLSDSLFTPVHRDTLTQQATDSSRAGSIGGMSILRRVGVSTSPVFFGFVLEFSGFVTLFFLVGLTLVAYAGALFVYYPEPA